MKKNRFAIFVLVIVLLSLGSFSIIAMAAKSKTENKKTTVSSSDTDTKKTSLNTTTATTTKIQNSASLDQPLTTSTPTTATGETIPWQVLSAGATSGSSTNYSLGGTIGQTFTGMGSSAMYGVNSGFWQDFASNCCVVAGDFNHDGDLNIKDLTDNVSYQFKGGDPPVCFDEMDVNGDGLINIKDLTDRVSFQFKGGDALVCGTVGSK